jgi:hypothetical protein
MAHPRHTGSGAGGDLFFAAESGPVAIMTSRSFFSGIRADPIKAVKQKRDGIVNIFARIVLGLGSDYPSS